MGTDLEHDLHLVELTPGLLACEHLDDETADRPDVGLEGVGGLTDNLGSHPCGEGRDEWKDRVSSGRGK